MTIVGSSNIEELYDLGATIGKGQFGLVKLANNKKTGKKVAIKIIEKKNMKPIEIF